MSVRVNINNALNVRANYKIVLDAEYSDSVLMGFVYKSGRRHTEWDYLAELTSSYGSKEKFKELVKQGKSFKEAAEGVAEGLAEELREVLREAPVETLKWWIEDYSPSDHVTVEK
jgi:hypothetical protein